MIKVIEKIIWVKSLHDGERHAEGYDSWIEYWLEKNNRYTSVPLCPRCNERKATDGSHVIKVNSEDKKWYIVPLCETCNEKKDDNPFRVKESMLVIANQVK